jgi:hypothetical protein
MPTSEVMKHGGTQEASRMLSDIVSAARAANDPRIIRELWDIAKEVREFDAKQAFFAAMKACQDEIKPVLRSSENKQTGSKYAKLEHIDKLIKPIYQRHGFSLMWSSPMIDQPAQQPGSVSGKVMVSCTVVHTGGYSMPFTLPGPLDIAGLKGTQNKTEMWALGSSLSYLKRYLKCFIFDIVLTDEDDDGQGTAERVSDEQLEVIEKFIDQCKMTTEDRKRFEEFMGVKMTADILARDVLKALNQLKDFHRRKFPKRQPGEEG